MKYNHYLIVGTLKKLNFIVSPGAEELKATKKNYTNRQLSPFEKPLFPFDSRPRLFAYSGRHFESLCKQQIECVFKQ